MEDGVKQVILFDGIQQVVMFHGHLVTILNLLQTYRSERRINIDGWQEKESASFSLAAFSLLDDYMRNGNPLIALGDILGHIALQNVTLGYEAAIAFVLAHEVGHLALGHIRPGAISERHNHHLAIPETINTYQEKEFEADRYALFAFNEQVRVILMSSVIFLKVPMSV